MRLFRIAVLILRLILLIGSIPAMAGEPTTPLKSTIDKVLKKPQNAKKRRKMISQIIHDRFNPNNALIKPQRRRR